MPLAARPLAAVVELAAMAATVVTPRAASPLGLASVHRVQASEPVLISIQAASVVQAAMVAPAALAPVDLQLPQMPRPVCRALAICLLLTLSSAAIMLRAARPQAAREEAAMVELVATVAKLAMPPAVLPLQPA